MSLLERIFGNKPAQQPQQQQVTNNPATNSPPQQPASSQVTAPNGVVPADGATPPANKSPEDKFATLWDPTPEDKTKQTEQDTRLTPEKMLEAAGKVDFKRVLDSESLAKVKAGGDEAVQALAELLNKTAQTVYGQSTVVAKHLIDAEVAKARQEFADQIPTLVRKQSMRESLVTENPAFKKPSVAPIVEAIQTQLAVKYPKATASELNAMAKEYLQNAAKDFGPAPKQESTPETEVFDWEKYLETGSAR